jgi:IS5 family transposase
VLDHPHSRDLARMSAVLDQLDPDVWTPVCSDLHGDACEDCGRRGLAAEQVLRIAVLKQLTGMSFDRLAFALADSMTYRGFCRLDPSMTPKRSTLADNVKRLSPETLERIHCAIVSVGRELGVEDGERVGIDSTAIEANVHHPTDSSLLYDCARKLTALVRKASEVVSLRFSNHLKRAKRRALAIANAKSMRDRRPLYRDLLDIVGWCTDYAKAAVMALRNDGRELWLADRLEHFIELTLKVHAQTVTRVFEGQTVPVSDKVLSIFEPHTDLIIKDNRGEVYGHKAFLTVSSSGLVLDLAIPRGNPADVTLAEPLVKALRDKHGITPTEAAFDGGFCSHANLSDIKQRGVEAVAFTSPRGLSVEQMTGTKERFRVLRNFRASIEGTIGWLKNVFGLRRCIFRGFASFQCYAWASVLALNLLVIARHS